ncbi:VanZ family protein [Ligilactobacillus apodemi]|uniref:VanZ family protein n=1 Tax=Ligilactobacillus apodemi DSM 16634 = JCM 16172 TaxID=1423724 RepID=A0A0R1TXX2_9LACO|nr:VanZ family protein [Ligilactobacillus apodemi]KRL86105.1 VanZ family protein [Ligilactobacillus apodemi DSM 16634 = JCM 16172]MCR1902132.1 VanZ family protein [Ligilactobacillus apodemi]
MKKTKRLFTWANFFLMISLLIVIILFVSSSMTYSQQTSVPFLQKYLTNKPYETELLPISFSYGGKVISIESVGYYKFIEFFIRKAAHFFTYFFLGAFLSLGLATYVKRMWIVILSSLILAGGYAAFDEFHQMLTGDRTPLIQDVILDSIGALCGILLAVSCYYIFQKTRTKK